MLSLMLSGAFAAEIAVTLNTPVKVKVDGHTVSFDLAEGQAVDRQLPAGTYDVEIFSLLGGKLATLDVTVAADERVELRYAGRQLTEVDRTPVPDSNAVQDFEADLKRAADDLEEGVNDLLGRNRDAESSEAPAEAAPAEAAPAEAAAAPTQASSSPEVGASAHATGPVVKSVGPAEPVDMSTLAVLILDGVDVSAGANLDGAGLPYEGDAWQLAGLPPGVYALSFEVEGAEQLFPVTLAAGRTTRCTWEGGGLGCAFE